MGKFTKLIDIQLHSEAKRYFSKGDFSKFSYNYLYNEYKALHTAFSSFSIKYLLSGQILGIVITGLIISFTANSYAQQADTSCIEGQILVMLEGPGTLEEVLQTPLSLNSGRPLYVYSQDTLSESLKIYCLAYDSRLISGPEALEALKANASVKLAQYHHKIHQRRTEETFPNDPQLQEQWGLHNTGQSDGSPDADVDAPEAWDISQGGEDSLGRRPIVAVIDDGFELEHPDLNFWKNTNEIPDNGIDDDNNGYIDDYDGWNSYEDNGQLPFAGHGTQVAGVIGARGNNGLGVSGMAWDIPILPVAGSSILEAIAIKAYSYVWDMRRLYESTGGEKGAYVVVSNSSFGVAAAADPAQFPIWCALYDSLGKLGILNIVSTSNQNRDVDNVGDVPSACTSDFVIAVQSSDRNDQRVSSGFGKVNIDLAAPGRLIFTTTTSESYRFANGTSFAAPFVSGVAALMHTAACPEFLVRYRNSPALTTLQIKQLILDATDTVEALEEFNLTGGRLNAYQSLLSILNICDTLPACSPPFDLLVSEITDESALIRWRNLEPGSQVILEYRPKSSGTWETVAINRDSIVLNGLLACTEYEYRLSSNCSQVISNLTPAFSFRTDGCCIPPQELSLEEDGDNSLRISWNEVTAAMGYRIRYRPEGTNTWNETNSTDTTTTISALESCLTYELQVASQCDTGLSAWSPSLIALTRNCGFCRDTEYCVSEGRNSSAEWIDEVKIGPLENRSRNDGGYGDFTLLGTDLLASVEYEMELIPGHSGFPFLEYWNIWVDLNQDGLFDDENEILYSSDQSSSDTVRAKLIIPASATEGLTRMRISMQPSRNTNSCGDFANGEVEDYCINVIKDPDTCLLPISFQAEAVPFQGIDLLWEGPFNADSYFLRYRAEDRPSWQYEETNRVFALLRDLRPCSIYEIQIATICGGDTSSWVSFENVQTRGCGSCTDSVYCSSSAFNATEEWIAKVQLGNNVQESESDGGYGDYTGSDWLIQAGESVDLVLTPGFSGRSFSENWKIWADWNQNGVFDPDEEAFDSGQGSEEEVRGTLLVPNDLQPGTIRMRVSMRFQVAPEACENFSAGEVEDYCLKFLDPNANNTEVSLFPQPASELLYLESESIIEEVQIYNMMGQRCISWVSDSSMNDIIELSIAHMAAGIYVVIVNTDTGTIKKKMLIQR